MEEQSFQAKSPLKHLAFIMDGNGRWAKKRLLPRSLGHKAGVKRIKEIVDACFLNYGIKAVSLFTFSTENWNRPEDEIKTLFQLLKEFFESNIADFIKKGVRIFVSGDLSDPRIPEDVLSTIKEAMKETEHLDKFYFNVLFNYGGRKEIVKAVKEIAGDVSEGKLSLAEIDEKTVSKHLYFPLLPDIDLLIRTSGEERLSNCLLYECAYAEFIFTPCYWPDFNLKELDSCLLQYQKRNRRFGAIK